MRNEYNIERVCTSSAEKSLLFAREEAKTLGQSADARHLMLGLLREGKGIGAKHLSVMKVNSASVRLLVDTYPQHSERGGKKGLEQYLERAYEECISLGHDFIGSEHLLLSILNDGSNRDLFRKLNVEPSSARSNLLQLLGA